MNKAPVGTETRTKLLDAGPHVIRLKGHAATTVEDICSAAGPPKGSSFHHTPSKEELGIAAAEHLTTLAAGLVAAAPCHARLDPARGPAVHPSVR